jgi:hypothetical protein
MAPSARLRAAGVASPVRIVELALEIAANDPPDLASIERELSHLLPGATVTVRAHRGEAEAHQLIRLVSGRDPSKINGVAPQGSALEG